MSTWRTNIRKPAAVLAGALVAPLLTVLTLAAPAQAHDAAYVELRAVEGAGSVKLRAERHGWGVEFRPRYVVYPDDTCFYYELKVMVDDGPDPDRKVGPVCSDSRGRLSDAERNTIYRTRVVDAGLGSAVTGAQVTFCLEKGLTRCDRDSATPPQHRSHATSAQLTRASALMDMSLADFLEAKKSGSSTFNWHDDGCSAPDAEGFNIWNRRFRVACERHDFGYKNFGAGDRGNPQWFGPTDAHKIAIDRRMYADMLSRCAANPHWGTRTCSRIARVYLTGVSLCGGSSFYREGFADCKRDPRLRDLEDTEAPAVTAATATLQTEGGRHVGYTLAAGDDIGVTERRVSVNGSWRGWTPFATSGTVLLPDTYGHFRLAFQVRDAAGRVSPTQSAGTVTRSAPVALDLRQIDNNGTVRSCGAESNPCTDVVRKFRATLSTPVLPDTDLLVKAWRAVDGTWVETNPSPLMRAAITGRVVEFSLQHQLMSGLWRFQVQVPRDPEGVTAFGSSGYQYLRISPPPDTSAPVVTGSSLGHGDPASQFVSFSLAASDNTGVTQMRVLVNGAERPWVDYVQNGTVVLPDGYGNFGIGFQVRDAAGNVSAVHFAGTVTRRAAVSLTLDQVTNTGEVRSCGTESNPCTPVVKKFRTIISSPVSPNADLLLKAWRFYNGSWTETTASPFMRETINGRTVITIEVTANLASGLWRFQTQVPVTDSTQFAASGYQFMRFP